MSVFVDCYSYYCITVRWTLICNSSSITSAGVWVSRIVSIIVRTQVDCQSSTICNTFFNLIHMVLSLLLSTFWTRLCLFFQWHVKKKGKVRPCTGCTAHRGSRGIGLPFHDHSTRREWGVSVTPRPLFTSGKDLVPIVQEAGWATGPVWTGVENLAPTEIRSTDRRALS
jgi:hypothetical protein